MVIFELSEAVVEIEHHPGRIFRANRLHRIAVLCVLLLPWNLAISAQTETADAEEAAPSNVFIERTQEFIRRSCHYQPYQIEIRGVENRRSFGEQVETSCSPCR